MMKNNDPKKIFTDYIKKNLIGPVNDTFACEDERELTLERPLRKYYSGIIFPSFSTSPEPIEDEDIYDDEDKYEDEYEQADIWENEQEELDPEAVPEPNYEDNPYKEELYPYAFGLSICLPADVESIKVRLKYGTYSKRYPNKEIIPEKRIRIARPEDYDQIRHLRASKDSALLSDLLGYDSHSNTVYLKRKINENSEDSGKTSTGDFKEFIEIRNKIWDKIKTSNNESDKSVDEVLNLLSPLFRDVWKRQQYIRQIIIPVSDIVRTGSYSCELLPDSESIIRCKVHAILLSDPGEPTIVKLLVENKTPLNHENQLMTWGRGMDERCMFQAELEVEADHFDPMPTLHSSQATNFEDMVVECQYRETRTYAQSFNCACSWEYADSAVKLVKTEFMPKVTPTVTTNFSSPEIRSILNIFNNSSYLEVDDAELVSRLYNFANCYEKWVDTQIILSKQIEPDYKVASDKMVDLQLETLVRMREGIGILEKDSSLMRLYRIANAAMLANMAVSKKRGGEFEPEQCKEYHYHPFQLAFLLINIPCTVNPESKIREESIDLLWFPTGGGKTEAYLLLSAFTLLVRRFRHGDEGLGTSIIMRYTLRLLTSQQFERATRMILALNYVCSDLAPELIETELFSSGLWIGSASSPNHLFKSDNSAQDIYDGIMNAKDEEDALRANKFPISECPWCGQSLIEFGKTGFSVLKSGFNMNCLNASCHFHDNLPIDLVDESLYMHPPSLLFATVDKFARLAWVPESAAFFGGEDRLPPELIIQDELHLISGPLGSITALFEGIVELLCRNKDRKPRIIASTATIKNASSQVRSLFGNRKIKTFPPPGINKDDNFFAKEDKTNRNREYVGIMPTGKTFITTQVRLLGLLLAIRHKLMEKSHEGIDNYWTVVSYYNSLRELGRMHAKVNDEIKLSYRYLIKKKNPNQKSFRPIKSRELTSRISGFEVKKVLNELERVNVTLQELQDFNRCGIDLVFATNMISVGLDIERLNSILLNGQPKNVSEYIQVTSRIARKHPGLIFTLFNPFRVRDRSHFENFTAFHQSYYRHVEPISVTPYTKVTISKMAPTLMAAFLRIVANIEKPIDLKEEDLEEFEIFMSERIKNEEMSAFLSKKFAEHLEYLDKRSKREPELSFKDLLVSTSDILDSDYIEGEWVTMNSMREINPNAVVKIVSPEIKRNRRQRRVYDE